MDCISKQINKSVNQLTIPFNAALTPSTNQHPAFYSPDVLPVAQPIASEH